MSLSQRLFSIDLVAKSPESYIWRAKSCKNPVDIDKTWKVSLRTFSLTCVEKKPASFTGEL